jgi:hypothetical protein
MGGGLMGLKRYMYQLNIEQKEPITQCFITKNTNTSQKDVIDHLSMICYTLLENQTTYDKSQFVHAIEEIQNTLSIINN